jgi:hypothetical protein
MSGVFGGEGFAGGGVGISGAPGVAGETGGDGECCVHPAAAMTASTSTGGKSRVDFMSALLWFNRR